MKFIFTQIPLISPAKLLFSFLMPALQFKNYIMQDAILKGSKEIRVPYEVQEIQ